MKKIVLTVAAATLALSALTANAARPTGFVLLEKETSAEGDRYSNYLVKCSNGTTAQLTAWNNRKKWCIGEDSSENCNRKQIKAAKQACNAS